MYNPDQILDKVNTALDEVKFNRPPRELYEPIEYILSIGGKRIRPVMLLLTTEIFGGNIRDAINPAVAMEIFHNFTLVHDDIMDVAPIRRGKETVFKKWNANIAILSGDAMYAVATQWLIRTRPDLIVPLIGLFTQTACEVCEGQQLDINYETRNDVSLEEYLEMIRLKTSALIASSLKMGAMIAGAEDNDIYNIYSFGENVGMAFQLQDDLLDVYANEDKFGKKIGGDILTNKKTFLYIKALCEAKGDDKKTLDHYFSSTNFNPEEKIKIVTEVYDHLKIKETTIALINSYYNKALNFYACLSADNSKKQLLRDYCDKLMKRDF